jgi:type IX secretion system PorP/SprF family membrane protein
MKKLFVQITIAVAGFTGVLTAQQDPQFTQFMHNKLIYNPGYAGTSGAICGVAQYRQQWASFPGAPQTIAFAGDMRLASAPIGLGLTVISDKIGPMNTMFLRVAGSFNIIKIAGGTLGIGLDLGMLQKQISSDGWVVPEPLLNDPRIPGAYGSLGQNNQALNKTNFDLGFGAFYQIPGKFYAGLSSTHLPAQQLKDGDLGFKVNRHYYFMTGYSFQLTSWSKLTPNILYKFDNSASAADLNLTYLWSDMVWIGGTYRINDAPAILAGYQGKAGPGNSIGYKIGLSYDFPGAIGTKYSSGTYEMLLGVCYTPKVRKETTYMNDRYLE